MTDLTKIYGPLKTFTVPSGMEVTIRRQNGDDDDVISNVMNAQDGTAFNQFVAGIIISTNKHSQRLTLEDVLALRLKDKYVILLQSRIFSLGSKLKFSQIWDPSKPKESLVNYTEDLNNYIWDYSKPVPELGEEGYFKYRIPGFMDKELGREITLSSGKVVKYTYANGHSEKYLLTLPDEQRSKNKALISRNLQFKDTTGKWVDVQKFTAFDPKDMMEIRKDVYTFDPDYEPITELVNPKNPLEIIPVNIIANADFFYPQEI